MPPVSQWPKWIASFIGGLFVAAWSAITGNFKRQTHSDNNDNDGSK